MLITPNLSYISLKSYKSGYIKDAFRLIINPSKNYLLFELYFNLFKSIGYELDEHNYYYKIDQSVAAEKNRVKLTKFLKDLEIVTQGNIEGFYTNQHLTKSSIFKYGYTEDAVLIESDYTN